MEVFKLHIASSHENNSTGKKKIFSKFVGQYFTLYVDIMEINIGSPSQPRLIITRHSHVHISHDKIQAQQELI